MLSIYTYIARVCECKARTYAHVRAIVEMSSVPDDATLRDSADSPRGRDDFWQIPVPRRRSIFGIARALTARFALAVNLRRSNALNDIAVQNEGLRFFFIYDIIIIEFKY